jgi:hypothetical protein
MLFFYSPSHYLFLELNDFITISFLNILFYIFIHNLRSKLGYDFFISTNVSQQNHYREMHIS